MSIWDVMDQLTAAEVRMLPLSDVRTLPSLQPRNGRLVPFKDCGRVEQRSAEHSTALGLVLDCSRDAQLEPILVADISDDSSPSVATALYVVDGHHRLAAYQAAKREAIPARVLQMSLATAVLVSKPINCTGRSLEMHREQRLDAAWQYLAAVTKRGASALPDGESTRTVARSFGIGHNTVARMLAELSGVDLKDFPPGTRDAGTDWPCWRYVRQPKSPWQTSLELLPDDEKVQRVAMKLARSIVDLMDKSCPLSRARALEILAHEEIEVSGSIEAVDFLAKAVRPHGTCVELVLSQWDSSILQSI